MGGVPPSGDRPARAQAHLDRSRNDGRQRHQRHSEPLFATLVSAVEPEMFLTKYLLNSFHARSTTKWFIEHKVPSPPDGRLLLQPGAEAKARARAHDVLAPPWACWSCGCSSRTPTATTDQHPS